MISGRGIIFAPDDELELGMTAEIVIDWPRLLDDRIRLQLVLQVTTTGTQGGVSRGAHSGVPFPHPWAGGSGAES